MNEQALYLFILDTFKHSYKFDRVSRDYNQ